ncbi:MAG TPA: hypothetical protein EYQ00_01715 [Dehalococcoidia bacterium]|nr:hypothetical protein [Dehalococcoidia bacterium]
MDDFSDTPIIEIAAIIANHLEHYNISVVLVGGLAVEFYSEKLYLTRDIDMVDTSYQLPTVMQQAMEEIGFSKQGRVYVNETTDVCVEFPSAPLSVGEELIQKTTIVDTSAGKIPILLAKDVIKDRLAAYFHWNDRPSLVQALAVTNKHGIDEQELRNFCQTEGHAYNLGSV